ncbi:hypothetical protein GCM10007916_11110 [Psychromonas marina]|uniref:Flagellar biosynthesis protein FlgT n=1 Tax=Psychromonas marina TaxID=88364 RepID=A0ABQ6DY22_9GAMM|nr:hypothetical protein GCM10007916_11110 [Psychromonas marina]
MKGICKSALLISALFSLSFNGQAAWYTGEGSAKITSRDISTSRDQAISNALLSVTHQAGTSIESIQVVESGVLKAEELTIKTNGEVHDMRLISEKISNGMIHVSIEADLYPFSVCPREKYAKTLFVGPFQLQTRKQAQLGGIYHSDEAVAQRLFYKLKKHPKKIDPRFVLTPQIAFTNDNMHNVELQILDVARQIASKYDVQYLLFGTIEDMSDYYETTKRLLVDRTEHRRNFEMDIYLVDAINKITIFQKNYASSSEWPFEMTHRFDVNSEVFWQTDYGQIMTQSIEQAVKDVQQALYCEPTMATIIAKYSNKVVMNIGHRNGVKKGDQFQLIRSQHVTHQASSLQGPIFIPDDVLLTVTSLQSDRAILETTDPMNMNNIQIRDMLTPASGNILKRLTTDNTF